MSAGHVEKSRIGHDNNIQNVFLQSARNAPHVLSNVEISAVQYILDLTFAILGEALQLSCT